MDWLALVLVLSFAVRGWMRGFLSQLFGMMGIVVALYVAGWLTQWVGGQWLHARPAVLFLILRAVVVIFTVLAVAALFGWLGTVARDAVREGPLGVIEGPGGLAIGASIGTLFVVVMMFLALEMPWPDAVAQTAARARLAVPMMRGAARACGAAERWSPGMGWLRTKFLKAERRAQSASRSV
jgi:uncharacterized membrane protein required for colicin V production